MLYTARGAMVWLLQALCCDMRLQQLSGAFVPAAHLFCKVQCQAQACTFSLTLLSVRTTTTTKVRVLITLRTSQRHA